MPMDQIGLIERVGGITVKGAPGFGVALGFERGLE